MENLVTQIARESKEIYFLIPDLRNGFVLFHFYSGNITERSIRKDFTFMSSIVSFFQIRIFFYFLILYKSYFSFCANYLLFLLKVI